MDDINWERWFLRFGDYKVQLSYYECSEDISVENLYQYFKARMTAELRGEEGPYKVSGNTEDLPEFMPKLSDLAREVK